MPSSPLKKGADPLEGIKKQGKTGCPERVRPLFQRAAKVPHSSPRQSLPGRLNRSPNLLDLPQMFAVRFVVAKQYDSPASESRTANACGAFDEFQFVPDGPGCVRVDAVRDGPLPRDDMPCSVTSRRRLRWLPQANESPLIDFVDTNAHASGLRLNKETILESFHGKADDCGR